MTPAQDPFYVVKEEIEESIDKLQTTFHQWEETPSNTGEWVHLSKELVASCESIEWQVDELDKTITVAARDPAWYGLDKRELEKRKRWTKTAHSQVDTIRKTIEVGKEKSNLINSGRNGVRQELMHLPKDIATQTGRSNPYQDNDEFISSESDRQMLLIRQQDEELDELSASVQRIGGVGLTIHEELIGQEKILEDLSMEMETTSNRLDFVQKQARPLLLLLFVSFLLFFCRSFCLGFSLIEKLRRSQLLFRLTTSAAATGDCFNERLQRILMETIFAVAQYGGEGLALELTVLTCWESVIGDICERWDLDPSGVRVRYIAPDDRRTTCPIDNSTDFVRMCNIFQSFKKNIVDLIVDTGEVTVDDDCGPSLPTKEWLW